MLAVQLLGYLRRNRLDLAGLDRLLPGFSVEERTVEIDRAPARLLEQLHGERAGEGVLVRGEKGVALLRPRKNGSAIRVFAEAANWETAKELCADISGRLGRLLDKEEKKG